MGAGTPTYGPGTTLPGAEYFALAPNRNIALGPRLLQQSGASAANSVPANAVGSSTVQTLLMPQFTYSSGVWVVRSYVLFQPTDATGELQISAVRMGVGPAPSGNIFVDVGTPLAILSQPVITQVAISDRDFLVTALDLGPSYPFPAPLFMYHQVAVRNLDATNPHSFTIAANTVSHQVQGFVQ